MPIKIEGFPYYAVIVGFEDVKVADIEDLFKQIRPLSSETIIQLFDASLIAGEEHLYFAALNALTAFKNRTNISNSIAVEILLYASAERQITEAFKKLGVKPETRNIAAIILSKQPKQADSTIRLLSRLLGGRRNDSVVELSENKLEKVKALFAVSELELQTKQGAACSALQALKDLVIEHMALLVTRR